MPRRALTTPAATLLGAALLLCGARTSLAWRATISGSASGNDEASAVASDGAGNAVVAGTVVNTGTGADFLVAKFRGGDGLPLWRYEFDGSGTGFNQADAARAVAVDSHGDVVAAGYTGSSTTG